MSHNLFDRSHCYPWWGDKGTDSRLEKKNLPALLPLQVMYCDVHWLRVIIFLEEKHRDALIRKSHCGYYSDVIMSEMASQTTGVSIIYSSLLRRRSKKTSELRFIGLCEGNSPVTGEFPAQRSINVENASIWWRHHDTRQSYDSYISTIGFPLLVRHLCSFGVDSSHTQELFLSKYFITNASQIMFFWFTEE